MNTAIKTQFHTSPALRVIKPCLENVVPLEARRSRHIEFQERLAEVAAKVQTGVRPEEVLDHVYESFRGLIPFVRIGCALLEQDGTVLRAFWARAEYDGLQIGKGYAQPLAGSSLQTVLETLEPRILNDLEAYLEEHPDSDATRRVVAEGVRSSLTCPLVSFQGPLGFLFFSFSQPNVYRGAHVAIFQQLAAQIAGALEKARMIVDLEAANHRLEQVMRMVAHDVRNPANVIRGFAEVISDGAAGPTTTDQAELLGDIAHEADRLLCMAQDLIDFRALVAGRLDLEAEPMDLVPLVQARVRAAEASAEAKDIRLALEAPAAVTMTGDARRLEQVVDNLLSNAVKYSSAGAMVMVGIEIEGPDVLVGVVDDGPGIPAAEQEKLFTEFGRTSVRPTAGEPSTGLGLAIVRRLVEGHGGAVGVQSAEGQGSTFWVRLPR